MLNSLLEESQLAIQQNQHSVNINIEIEHFYADAVLLRRILDNLLSNALAYGDNQTPITLNAYRRNSQQIIELANGGRSISESEKSTLFQPFQRGQINRNDRISGSGLGLSIVHECAALMSGSVQFVEVDFASICVQVKIPLQLELA